MTIRFPSGDTELPDDLAALDAELASIQYEERPSFQPELRAELAGAWAQMPQKRTSALRRHVAAAVLALLLVGGASVPSARASFVRLIGVLSVDPIEVEVATTERAPALPAFEGEVAVTSVATEVSPPEPPVVVSEVEEPVVVPDVVMVAPEMLDREGLQEILQDAYPMYLQRRGVGGTAWLRLFVDEFGRPGDAGIARSSGVPDLDRAAVRAAPRFRFSPARQGGRHVGTWIVFSVMFEPDAAMIDRVLNPVIDPLSLPTVDRSEWWMMSDALDLEALRYADDALRADDAARSAAETNLELALSDPGLVAQYGPISAILSGEAPAGISPAGGIDPVRWRSAVGSALEYSIQIGTETAPALLALGRIRLRQGLHTEARSLFEQGLQQARRDEDEVSPWVVAELDHQRGVQRMVQEEDDEISPWVVAELHYERGKLVRDSWLASEGLGRVPADAFSGLECAQARSSGGSVSGYASVERMIAWNYLCPTELSEVFGQGFEASNRGSAGDLTLMMASFRAAAEAYPAHVGANTDLLITLASEKRWDDMLSGARRFTRVSDAHPNGLLLAGLALHRLGRSEEAASHFEAALERLSQSDAEALTDITFLLDRGDATRYQRATLEERRDWEQRVWATKDRDLSTDVNERWVEHIARATVAHLRFGSVFGDAGEVWVRFGGPKTIHIIDEGSGRQTEFWDYGSGPDITFVRWVSSKRTDLTPEGRAYVDDLGKIFPPQ